MHTKENPGSRFRRFALSSLCAQCAEQIGLAAAPILAVYLFAASSSQVALLQTMLTAPFLLLAIPAGVLADRLPRRSMLVAAELLRASCFAVILLLLASGTLTLVSLAVLGFVGAAGTVAYNVTVPGTTPLLVARQYLPVANSRLELARSIAFSAGPSVAGLVYGALGGVPSYAIALVLSLSAAGLVALMPLAGAPAAARGRLWPALREGFGFTFADRHLRPVLYTAVAFNTAWFLLQAAFVPYAASHLGMDAAAAGAAMALYGVGMICGALLTPRLSRALRFGQVIVLGPVGGFLGAVLMAASVWVPARPLVWAGFFFFGAGPVIWSAATATLRQAVTPPALIGRVSAVVTTFTFGARPLGALIAAVVAATYGPSACIVAALAGFAIQLAIILHSTVRDLVDVPALEHA